MTTEPSRTAWTLARAPWRLGLVLGCLLAGCAAGVPRVASDLEADVPASLHADYVSFTQNCNKCHSLDRPLTAHVTDVRHWDIYVAKMMRTAGSAISARESPKILRFLYWYTQRKQRLASEGEKKVAEPEAAKQSAPSAAPAANPAPASAPAAQSPATDSEPNQAPAQVNQGEAAP